MEQFIAPVALDEVSKLLNPGPTTLVSAQHHGVRDVMAASWVCALDYAPPKLSAVLDKKAKTRTLIEKSGYFVIQIPTVSQLQITYDVGHCSLHDAPHKLGHSGITLFNMPGYELPFVQGCAGWLVCKLIVEAHNQEVYDLFIAEIVAAWSDIRVFKNGHWNFESADPKLRSLHYVAGGHFYAIGEALEANSDKL